MEYFPEFPVQQDIKLRFINSYEKGRMAHAYLFHGPEGSGKEAFALELARMLNCRSESVKPCGECSSCSKSMKLNHPDIHLILPVTGSTKPEDIQVQLQKKAANPFARIMVSGNPQIPIDRIRELKNEAKYAPYEGDKKVYIVLNAEKMTRESANSFLKLLEEPPPSLLLILITSLPTALMDTIRSRCHAVHFKSPEPDGARRIIGKYAGEIDNIDELLRISEGNIKKVFDMLETESGEKRAMALQFLRAAAAGKAQLISEVVDSIQKENDKNFLKELLNLIILWFRDSLNRSVLGTTAAVINADFENEIVKFTEVYGNSDFNGIVDLLEQALNYVDRNVHRPLILTSLAIKLNRLLVKSS